MYKYRTARANVSRHHAKPSNMLPCIICEFKLDLCMFVRARVCMFVPNINLSLAPAFKGLSVCMAVFVCVRVCIYALERTRTYCNVVV